MPERPYRRAELHAHLVRSSAGRPPWFNRLLWERRDWPECEKCGIKVDPRIGPVHPGCAEPVYADHKPAGREPGEHGDA